MSTIGQNLSDTFSSLAEEGFGQEGLRTARTATSWAFLPAHLCPVDNCGVEQFFLGDAAGQPIPLPDLAFAYDATSPVQTRSGAHLAVLSNGGGGAPYATLSLIPPTSAITPEDSAVFSADIDANFDDTFDLIAYAPAGWHVSVAGDGTITARPGVGATAGDYSLLVTAQSQSHREIVAAAEHTVTLVAHEALEFSVSPEPNLSIPMAEAFSQEVSNQTNDGEAEIPDAAYRIELGNRSTLTKTFTFSVSGAPAGWIVLDSLEQTSAQVTLPPGAQTVVGLYVAPPALPAPGTSFTMDVGVTDGGSLADAVSIPWSMPGQAFNHLTIEPAAIYVSPNASADFSLDMTNVGNVAGTFPISATLWLSTASLSNLQSPIALAVDESHSQSPTLNVPDVPLGTRFPLILSSPAPGSYTQYALADVQVVSEHSTPIFEAAYRAGSACSLDGGGLAASLEALALSINDLELSCDEGDCDLAQRDRAVAAAESVVDYARLASPLLTADEALGTIAADLSTHSDDAGIQADIAALAAAAAELETEMCETAEHAPAARFTPYLEAALPGQTVTYTLDVENQGTATTPYAITLTLPSGASTFTETIAAGATFTTPIAVATGTLGLHSLQAEVVAVGPDVALPTIADSATARLNVVARFVQVTAVTADPSFVETGASSTTLSVDVANVANVPREASARTTILAPAGGISWTADIPLTILAGSPRSYELGTVDTSGWAEGVYTLTVDLLDGTEALIPDGSGYGYLAVGQALIASHAVQPALVAPGAVTVTTLVTTEITLDTIGDNEPLSLAKGPNPRSYEFETVIAADAPPSLVASGPEPAILANATPEVPAPAHEPDIPSLPLFTDDPISSLHSPMPNPQSPTPNLQSPISIQSTFTRTEETDPAIVYTGVWGQASQALASGGTYRYADDLGDTATFTFYGDWVNVGFIGNTDNGQAEVFIDGVSQGVLDLYRREWVALNFVYDNLVTATHTISITVLGTQNAYASHDWVRLDYIDAWTGATLADGTFEQSDDRVLHGTGWSTYNDATASGGSYFIGSWNTAWFPFSGDSFSFHYVGRSGNGRARLYVDGHYLDTIQPYHYSTTIITGTVSYQGFGPGPHIVQVSTYKDNATVDAFTSPGMAPFEDPTAIDGYHRYEEDHPAWLYNGVPYTQTATTWARTGTNVADRSSGDQVIGSSTADNVAQITASGEWLNLGFGADWNSGQAEIFLDGVSQGTIDLHRRERGVVNQVFAGLANTSHTISVTVSGGGEVWIDYLDVWDGSVLTSGTFKDYPDGGYYRSGGWAYYTYPQDHWYSDNGTTWFPFGGDTVSYSYLGNTNSGRARIYVDQDYLGLFDLYHSPAMTQTLSFDGLGTGVHVLRVESYRNRLTFDAFKRPGSSPFYTPTVETGILRYEEDDPLWLYNGVPYTRTVTTWTRINNNLADRSSDDQIIGSSTGWRRGPDHRDRRVAQPGPGCGHQFRQGRNLFGWRQPGYHRSLSPRL